MGGTPEGGQNMRKTMIERFGSEAAWRQWMRGLGSQGGKLGHIGGFNSPGVASRAGTIGGKKSKRGKAKKEGYES